MFHISLVFRCIGVCHFFGSLYIIISIELQCRWFTALFILHQLSMVHCTFWFTGGCLAVAYYCVEVLLYCVFSVRRTLSMCVCLLFSS